jgi:hypothetical protein
MAIGTSQSILIPSLSSVFAVMASLLSRYFFEVLLARLGEKFFSGGLIIGKGKFACQSRTRLLCPDKIEEYSKQFPNTLNSDSD